MIKYFESWVKPRLVGLYPNEPAFNPTFFTRVYTLNSSPVVKTRRSADSFVEPIYIKETSRKSISNLGYKIWNGLDKNIKTST